MTAIIGNPEVGHPLHLEFIESFLVAGDDHDRAQVGDISLRSHYQPIYSFAHQRAVGFEALIRPYRSTGETLLPNLLFDTAQTVEDKIFLDRLCRTLHVRNFVRQSGNACWLFLNVDPVVTVYGKQFGSFFQQLLAHYRIPPHRVVIEILEGKIGDETLLAESVDYYRDIGCLIAIDDFGVGQSNFDRIWRMRPHIVKLDRSIIEQAADNRTVRRILPSFVSLVHEAGSLVLIEGVETEMQALIAMQAGIDFVQGYFFGKPSPTLPDSLLHPGIGKLFDQLREDKQLEEISTRRNLSVYTEAFFDVAVKILEGMDIDLALKTFLGINPVRRCYLLDELGLQVGSNYLPGSLAENVDARFEPLNDARNAIWMRRQYFQQAIAETGRVHISKPYLSITGGSLCVTLSIATYHGDKLRVLCGDINWVDE
jgi:EAL domain-containing protein (putative c-di-GMP-specific phosphodiesterase class I)